MPPFARVGTTPAKRFSTFRDADGTILKTEVMGRGGFSSDFSLLIHRECPSALVRIEEAPAPADPELVANHPLRPRLWTTSEIPTTGDLVDGRVVIAGNADVTLSVATGAATSALYKNTVADELHYVHDGTAVLETSFGALPVRQGDYVVIPRSTIHRWVVDDTVRTLLIETATPIRPPARYLSRTGQFLQTAPYSELDLRRPTEPLVATDREVPVIVTTSNGRSVHVFDHHPFDVVGWFGCNYPYALNIEDFSPVSGSFHRPPPVHQVFEATNVVVCNFVPRIMDYDPRAMPIPSYHSNVESDEVIFYAEGDFFSRKGAGIERGALTLHPAGHVHGPHPASLERGPDLVGKRTEEIAVMIDTFRPLSVPREPGCREVVGYTTSWLSQPTGAS